MSAFGVSPIRVWALSLVLGLIAVAPVPARALPFETDDRCPNVNTVAFKLQSAEQGHPELEPTDYVKVGNAYIACMKMYDASPNTWMIFYAGVHAMQWIYGGANMLAKTDKAQAVSGFKLVHEVYIYLVSAGIQNAQYGTDWITLDAAALKQLAALGGKP